MDGGAELTDAFSVDDAEIEYSAFAAEFDVVEDNRFYVSGSEGMQVEGAVDGDWNGVWLGGIGGHGHDDFTCFSRRTVGLFSGRDSDGPGRGFP